MKRILILTTLAIALVACGKDSKTAKQVFLEGDLKDMDLNDTSSRYCFERSAQTDDIIVFWEKGFGNDLSATPEYKGHNMNVDLDRLLNQTQSFYDLFRNDLRFIQEGSTADTFKMMVMLQYSDDGTAYGGADGRVGALWVTPLRTGDARLNAIAHELGHSFQFQLGQDGDTGFGGGGIYEMTSQWMLWQANPHWMDDETYHWDAFMDQTHLAFMHPANMYHSPYVLEYWSNKYGITFIGELWRSARHRHDVPEVYKDFHGMDQEQFNDEMFDACRHFIYYDLPRVKEVADPYADRHECEFTPADAEGWMSIAPSRTPQQYGYNGIRLNAPKAGETVRIDFRGQDGIQSAGWRYGFAGRKADGTIVYSEMSSEHEGSISFTAESDMDSLWLVVMAAPTENQQVSERNAEEYREYPYSIKIY